MLLCVIPAGVNTRAKCSVVVVLLNWRKMAEDDDKPRNFHEMELDDRILKVSI
jgi:hypothetical protein